jgi:hypothetical protein
MNETHQETTVAKDSVAKTCAGLLSTLGDVGVTWAAYGLKVGKLALETSAETLGRTAKALEILSAELAKKAAAEKAASAVDAVAEPKVDAGAAPDAKVESAASAAPSA